MTQITEERHSLVVLKPIIKSPTHNVIRIERVNTLLHDEIQHVGGGSHAGIIINKFTGKYDPAATSDLQVNFSVWLNDGEVNKQENRILKFNFEKDTDEHLQHEIAQAIFKDIITSFPKDYLSFIKRMLKVMQNGNELLVMLEIDMKFAEATEAIEMPDAKEYDSGSEVEDVTSAHVQEVLEHAYPSGLSLELIAEALRCNVELVEEYLNELAGGGIVQKVENEWIRVDQRHIDQVIATKKTGSHRTDKPTIAIITCLFLEKQAVDMIIEDPETIHRYKSGDSSIYTLGKIGNHKVVATKLAMIGDSRDATISAGSITTRLLGNFQHIEHVIVVGVAGGIPHITNATAHVRLGDVVVSAGKTFSDKKLPNYIYAYNYTMDRLTEDINGFNARPYSPADNILSQIASQTNDAGLNRDWNKYTEEIITKLNEGNDCSFSRPSNDTDILALPTGGGNVVVVPHPNADRVTSIIHVGPVGAMASIKRPVVAEEGEVEKNEPLNVDAICGPESSKNIAYQLKEKFVAQYQLKAMDAGFESVISAIEGSRIDSWALVRGISDYQHGQSRSGRLWQPYAAARSAALINAILERLPAN